MKQADTQTIAAIATAMSAAGIGIIRISGEDAIAVADRFYRNANGQQDLKSHGANTIRFGRFCDVEENILDEVLVSVMCAPHSYTGEDVVEINCHGGMLVMQKILETVLRDDRCQLAQPGEFTKRAFLNGRLDLSEAEAVMDVIAAENRFALENGQRILGGALREKVSALRAQILHETAFIESALDDPENYSLDGYPDRLKKTLCMLISDCDTLRRTAKEGQIRKEGIRCAIAGKPNAGKSSLFNELLQADRAIVTETPGTTRDTLEETVRLDDILLRLIDTAGIRKTEDAIEQIGVARAQEAIGSAALVLYVIDRSEALDTEDMDRITEIMQSQKLILLLNKSDLSGEALLKVEDIVRYLKEEAGLIADNQTPESAEYRDLVVTANETTHHIPVIETSMRKNELSENSSKNGLNALKSAVSALFFRGEITPSDEVYLTNVRQSDAFLRAREALALVLKSIDDGQPEDFYTIDLMNAYAFLGEITGEEVTDDLIDRIFSEFCMGK